MNILKLKKKIDLQKSELKNLSDKFKELKSLVYDYKDKKEEELKELSLDHENFKKKLKKIKKIMKK